MKQNNKANDMLLTWSFNLSKHLIINIKSVQFRIINTSLQTMLITTVKRKAIFQHILTVCSTVLAQGLCRHRHHKVLKTLSGISDKKRFRAREKNSYRELEFIRAVAKDKQEASEGIQAAYTPRMEIS